MKFERLGEETFKFELFFDDEFMLSEASLTLNAFGSLWKSKVQEGKKGKWEEGLSDRLIATDAQPIYGSIYRAREEFGDKESKPDNFENDYPKSDIAIASFETGKTGLQTIYDALIAHRDYTDIDMHNPNMPPFVRISEGVLADKLAEQIASNAPGDVTQSVSHRNVGFSA